LRYPTLSLEQVYATITYYLANQEQLRAYLALVAERQGKAWQEQQRNPSEFVRMLRERLERQRQILHEKRTPPALTVRG